MAMRSGEVDHLIYGVTGDAAAGTPEMWIVYRYDDELVTVGALNITDPVDVPEED